MSLEVKIYHALSGGVVDYTTLTLQDFKPDQTFNLYRHEYDSRRDKHTYHKIGEKNCLEDEHEIYVSKHGFIYSWAEVITKAKDLRAMDSVIFVLREETFVVNVRDYVINQNINTPIIDDMDLLMKKYKEII